MKSIYFGRFGATFIPVVGAVFVSTFALPAFAQNSAAAPIGLPQDWSHRHLIYSNPDTQEEAAAKGTLGEWKKKANDPRFVLQLEKKEQKQKAAAAAKEMARETELATGQASAPGAMDAIPSESALSANAPTPAPQAKKKPKPTPGTEMDRDWSNVMGGVSGAGDTRTYPAKFSFYPTTKDCAVDFVVFTTSTAGVAGTSGTLANRTGTFTAQPTAGQTATVGNTSHGTSIVLTATANIGGSNTGLNFQIGSDNTAGQLAVTAGNLAAAINRNGGVVGVTASSAAAVVTVRAITWGSAENTNITLAEVMGGFAWTGGATNLANGSGIPAQPTIFALNQLYADTTNGGCQTSTQAVPATFWSYNTSTATSTNAVADLSPALSFYDDGKQVAFIQRSSANVASLVLLKWSSTVSPGTLGVPTTPSLAATAADYRNGTGACSPSPSPPACMFLLSLGANDTNSAPFVDYGNDVIYVGDDTGRLHKFTGVFRGTPAEVVSAGVWPAQTPGTILSSPVYDSRSNKIFVGSNGTAAGNRLHSVDASTGTVVSSAGIGINAANVNGVRDAPIVDTTAQRVYAFVGSDNGLGDSLGNACGGANCNAIYQFVTTTSLATQNAGLGAGLGAKVIVGLSGNQNNLDRAISAGMFDDAYYSSADPVSPSGSLYVCGSAPGAARQATLWKVTISGNSFGARTQGPLLVSANANDGCSPVTVFRNGSTEYLFASVTNSGNAPGGGGCTTPANGCIYMYDLTNTTWISTMNATAALNARGGTGGIIIDNTLTGGGSQVYYSTRTSPGIAVQASQAGLQ